MAKKDKLDINQKAMESKRLQDYITGKLSKEEQYEFENNLDEDDPFLQDAIDGLKETKTDIDFSVYELNKQISKKLHLKEKRNPRKINTYNIGYVAMLLILALIVIAFIVIRMYLKSR